MFACDMALLDPAVPVAERRWDPPISNLELPHVRVREAAAALRAAGCAPITRIVSSPYLRTLQTASECARELGLSAVSVSGDFSRCTSKCPTQRTIPTPSSIAAALGGGVTAVLCNRWLPVWDEKYEASRVRVESAIDAILCDSAADCVGSTLVIGHSSLVNFACATVHKSIDAACCSWIALAKLGSSPPVCMVRGGGMTPEELCGIAEAEFLHNTRAQLLAYAAGGGIGDAAPVLVFPDLTLVQSKVVHLLAQELGRQYDSMPSGSDCVSVNNRTASALLWAAKAPA